MLIVNAWFAMGLWQIGSQKRHPRIAQPEKISHVTARSSTVGHTAFRK
ncbi:hypothetical protein Z945_1076 [Sulfitobacter noctilucae]|nr:hypothetical protein Z945_1076 [Sulfitobacter noctilucae]